MLHQDSPGDHVHEIAMQAGGLERIGQFDFDEVCRNVDGEEPEDTTVSMADASACFSLILEWILGTDSLVLAGARAASLAVYLDPTNNNRFGSTLAQIAQVAGCTRAALSKALIEFRDEAGILLSAGKGSESRSTFRNAQIKSFESGRHSAFNRKDKKPAEAISLEAVAD